MAYSLKDIGDRVAALEKAGSSSWTKGSNSNGNWVKESTTGLIIQWGRKAVANHTANVTTTITLPLQFTSNTSFNVASSTNFANDNGNGGWGLCSPVTQTSTTVGLKKAFSEGCTLFWIAIGYLITDRLLNIYYIAKSFTSSWIFSRFLQRKQRRCE